MMTATVITSFSSSHFLPFYEGKCFNMHGHNYKLEVTVAHKDGRVATDGVFDVTSRTLNNPEWGMVADFSLIKAIVTHVTDEFDHKVINDTIGNPTAENMSIYLWNRLSTAFLESRIQLVKIRLWETDNCFVEYTGA